MSNIAYMSGLRSLFQADGAANCDELVRRRNEDRILQTIGGCHQPSKATPIIIACLFFYDTLIVIHYTFYYTLIVIHEFVTFEPS